MGRCGAGRSLKASSSLQRSVRNQLDYFDWGSYEGDEGLSPQEEAAWLLWNQSQLCRFPWLSIPNKSFAFRGINPICRRIIVFPTFSSKVPWVPNQFPKKWPPSQVRKIILTCTRKEVVGLRAALKSSIQSIIISSAEGINNRQASGCDESIALQLLLRSYLCWDESVGRGRKLKAILKAVFDGPPIGQLVPISHHQREGNYQEIIHAE